MPNISADGICYPERFGHKMSEKYTLGFIGVGNMGGSLARAAAKNTNSIILSGGRSGRAAALSSELAVSFGSNADAAKNAEYIILGVKPQIIFDVISEISDILKERSEAGDNICIVSMAAGVEIKSIEAALPAELPIIRIMPNTPVSIGKGVILYTANSAAQSFTAKFRELFSKAGEFIEIKESLFNAGTALSGCSPAFVDIFVDALADGGVRCGLTRELALKLAAATVSGAAELISASGKHPDVLRDEVCSPGGSTIEGVSVLERGGFRATVSDAVSAAERKSAELGKKK